MSSRQNSLDNACRSYRQPLPVTPKQKQQNETGKCEIEQLGNIQFLFKTNKSSC